MKELKSILAAYDTAKAEGIRMALATVVHVEDSSYRRSGARMLIKENGTWVGGISGGCLEGDTLRKAKYAIVEQESVVVRYDTRTDDPSQIGVGLGCNGLIDVLITPLSDENNPLELLRKYVDSRSPQVLVTTVKSADSNLIGKVVEGESITDSPLRNEVDLVYQRRSSKKVETDGSVYFVEYLTPAIRLLIFGKNYDTIPLVRIARELGWLPYIYANPLKVGKELYELSAGVLSDKKSALDIDLQTVALLMSHDFATDKRNMIRLLDENISYIGLLGPKKRKDKLLTELKEEGYTIHDNIVFGPMGLDTGATSPEEIAISILAEIRSHLSDREGKSLRLRETPIH